MPKLTIREPDGLLRGFYFEERALIGRSPSCDLQIVDVSASSHHAIVYRDKTGKFLIEDLKSSNGLFIDNKRIRRAYLTENARFRIGSTLIKFSKSSTEYSTQQRLNVDINSFITQAESLAIGLDNTPSEGLLRAFRDLVALYELGNVLHSSNDEEELYKSIAALVIRATGAEQVSVVETDINGNLVSKVTESLSGHNFGTFTYSKTVLEQVLSQGKTILVSDPQINDEYSASMSMVDAEITAILCAPLKSRTRTLGMIFASHRGSSFNFDDYQRKLLTAIGLQSGIAVENYKLYKSQEKAFLATVEALVNALDAKDTYTVGHSRRVAEMSIIIARHLSFSESNLKTLHLGALLHDIGKIGIEDSLLKSSQIVDSAKKTKMYLHTVLGDDILKPLEGIDEVRSVVRHHHERWDGEGYPDSLIGEEIPLLSRIVCVADSIDAMTSDRSYRKGREFHYALEEIRKCSGKQFDPKVVSALNRAVKAGDLPI